MRIFLNKLTTLILILLAVAMLSLWTAFLYLQFDRKKAEVKSLDKDFWAFTGGESTPLELSENDFLVPVEAVSLVLSGNGYTSMCNKTLTDALYTDLSPLINEIFSDSYICESSDESEWCTAFNSNDSVFIEYFAPIPYTVLHELLQDSDVAYDTTICNIQKILIFSDKSNTPMAITTDGDGRYHSFKRKSDDSTTFLYDFNSNNLATYTVNKGFIPFEFNKGKYANAVYEHKLLDSDIVLDAIEITTPLQSTLNSIQNSESTSYLEFIQDNTLSELLNTFDINPQVVGYYFDTNVGLIFVGESMRLTVSPQGNVVYSLTNKSNITVSTSSLLKTVGRKFSSSELLLASMEFLKKLPEGFMGGDADIILKNISYDEKTMEFTFTYVYTYSGVQILKSSKEAAIKLVFGNNGLVRASLTPLNAKKADSKITSDTDDGTAIDAGISSKAALIMAENNTASITPLYNFTAFPQTTSAIWGGKK